MQDNKKYYCKECGKEISFTTVIINGICDNCLEIIEETSEIKEEIKRLKYVLRDYQLSYDNALEKIHNLVWFLRDIQLGKYINHDNKEFKLLVDIIDKAIDGLCLRNFLNEDKNRWIRKLDGVL